MSQNDFNEGMGCSLVIGTIITIMIVFLIVIPLLNNDDIEELGQAICEEEYDMDFDIYYDRKLKCKPKIIENKTNYDGIIIKVK